MCLPSALPLARRVHDTRLVRCACKRGRHSPVDGLCASHPDSGVRALHLRVDPLLDRCDDEWIVIPGAEIDSLELCGNVGFVDEFRNVILAVNRIGADRSREEEQALRPEGDELLDLLRRLRFLELHPGRTVKGTRTSNRGERLGTSSLQ